MISIITSLYKSESYLPAFVERAKKVHRELTSAKVAFEHLIIANDYSKEERKIVEGSGVTFRVIDVPRESLYKSWNRGVQLSSGSVVGFWNVDDTRFSQAILEGGRRLAEERSDVIYFPFRYKRYFSVFGMPIPITITIRPPQFERKKFMTEMHCGPFFMFRKEFYNLIGAFDDTFRIAGDYEWCSRAAARGTFARGKALAGIFVNEGKGLSTSKSTLHKTENARVLEKVGLL